MTNLTDTDQELILAYHQGEEGDKAAIALLYHRHYAAAYAAAHSVFRDPIEAKDVIDDDLERLWKIPVPERSSKFAPTSNVDGFIYIRVKRLAVSKIKKPLPPVLAGGDDHAYITDRASQNDYTEQEREEAALTFLSKMTDCRKVLSEADDQFLDVWAEVGPRDNEPLSQQTGKTLEQIRVIKQRIYRRITGCLRRKMNQDNQD